MNTPLDCPVLMAPHVKAHAAAELTSALRGYTLRIPIRERHPLKDIAIAHGRRTWRPGRVVLYL